ncbi:hypothetical protein [Streptomyces violascens]|uniref:hypothetical protein n=1 Tax=Streptomyces violascens TaxID=67381 RepID=UPI0036526B68
MVVQCTHSKRAAPVGVSAIQKLNGTARPVHGADIVIAIANTTFSRRALVRWATWGEPTLEVLGLEENRGLAA